MNKLVLYTDEGFPGRFALTQVLVAITRGEDKRSDLEITTMASFPTKEYDIPPSGEPTMNGVMQRYQIYPATFADDS